MVQIILLGHLLCASKLLIKLSVCEMTLKFFFFKVLLMKFILLCRCFCNRLFQAQRFQNEEAAICRYLETTYSARRIPHPHSDPITARLEDDLHEVRGVVKTNNSCFEMPQLYLTPTRVFGLCRWYMSTLELLYFEELEKLTHNVELEININKTKAMRISNASTENVMIQGQIIVYIDSICYLGNTMTSYNGLNRPRAAFQRPHSI